jgi:hypothetical protein
MLVVLSIAMLVEELILLQDEGIKKKFDRYRIFKTILFANVSSSWQHENISADYFVVSMNFSMSQKNSFSSQHFLTDHFLITI